MKHMLSRFLGGAIITATISYSIVGDPLNDVWQAIQIEEHDQRYTSNGDTPNGQWTNEARSRLVQQPGSGRSPRDRNDDNYRLHQRNHYTTLRAFRDCVGDTWKSTVQILDKNKPIAMGAVVSADGWIVTKSSELPDRVIEVKLPDGSRAEGMVKVRRQEYDLALVKIERDNLIPVRWNTTVSVPVGGWLASTDTRNLPLAIGVMSVSKRNIHRVRAVLGVTLGMASDGENGALVENVVDGSGAFRAGVQIGDLINNINGETLQSREEVLRRLSTLMAGQQVEVGFLRDGKQAFVTAQMMDLNSSLLDPTEMEVNGEISSRSTGFNGVMQHDSVLAPNQCGGPVVDVFGNAVGLNIARAGRVSSYAVPAAQVANALTEMLSSANAKALLEEKVVAASATNSPSIKASMELPASVPNGIVVEALKPEVVVPPAPVQP